MIPAALPCVSAFCYKEAEHKDTLNVKGARSVLSHKDINKYMNTYAGRERKTPHGCFCSSKKKKPEKQTMLEHTDLYKQIKHQRWFQLTRNHSSQWTRFILKTNLVDRGLVTTFCILCAFYFVKLPLSIAPHSCIWLSDGFFHPSKQVRKLQMSPKPNATPHNTPWAALKWSSIKLVHGTKKVADPCSI